MSRRLIPVLLFIFFIAVQNSGIGDEIQNMEKQIDALSEPLYSPFVERYVLDEMKQLRIDMANQKHELMQQVLDREHRSIDRGVTYATEAITYFFYLIAGATSLLVIIGWNSFRDIKQRAYTLADEQISKLVIESENRLRSIEQQLNQKTEHIESNREEIELTQEIQSLWLRAGQDNNPANKIIIYDQILKLKSTDCEALTYKADAVLELGEPQWAANLCHQALETDPDNAHAFYQLACAYTAMTQYDEAILYLSKALEKRENYRSEIETDPALAALQQHESLKSIMKPVLPG